MESSSLKDARAGLEPFLARSGAPAWALFLANIAIYLATVAGAVALPWTLAQLASAVLAGMAISALFVIGHDAAHGAFTDSRRANSLIGRVAFLPALHNYSLWQVQHNRLHHRLPNFKGINSWSPLTKAEYDAMPAWRRAVERLYRSALGFAPYYMVERWWKDKFFPRRRAKSRQHPVFWLDFLLLAVYLAAFLGVLAIAGSRLPQPSAGSAILWGFLVPFLVWNALMGATTYMQHTHPRVAWFDATTEWQTLEGQEEVTVHVLCPLWYGIISHNIMDHPAHHVHPKIPLYRLRAAQCRLNELMGDRAVIQPFSLAYLLTTLASCKLYDYREHRWLDFGGRPATDCTLPTHLQSANMP